MTEDPVLFGVLGGKFAEKSNSTFSEAPSWTGFIFPLGRTLTDALKLSIRIKKF